MPKISKNEDKVISQAVIIILKSRGGRLSLSEIYDDFWERYAVISPKKDFYGEYTKHGEPRYHHIVRAALNQLKNKGMVNNPRRGTWHLLNELRARQRKGKG